MADENSLREDLEESIGAVESNTPEETTTSEVQETAAPQATEETQEEVSGQESAGEPAAAAPQAPATPATQPPVDWAPAVKAEWSRLTPEVQHAISQREAHINETLRETSGIRQEYDDFADMIHPYIPLMQAEGAQDPQQAIQGLLNTTATLSMGSGQQKAQKIAAMIGHYGVDIEMLDQVLSGQQLQQDATAPADPRIDAIWNRMQQAEQSNANNAQYEASNDIQAFAANPQNVHFHAVKNVMADFIDMAGSHGQDMSLEDAYNRACLTDPNIAPLVTQQFNSQAAQGHQNAVAGARMASGSLAGKPASSGSTGLSGDMSLRETIASQFGGDGRI